MSLVHDTNTRDEVFGFSYQEIIDLRHALNKTRMSIGDVTESLILSTEEPQPLEEVDYESEYWGHHISNMLDKGILTAGYLYQDRRHEADIIMRHPAWHGGRTVFSVSLR